MISRFIWNGKSPQIKDCTVQLGKDEGGLTLPKLKRLLMRHNSDQYSSGVTRTIVQSQSLIGHPKLRKSLTKRPITLHTLNICFDFVKHKLDRYKSVRLVCTLMKKGCVMKTSYRFRSCFFSVR